MTGKHRHSRVWPGRPPKDKRDAGVAMLAAVMVITVIAVLGTSVAVLSTRSIRAAGDSTTAGAVKDLANAGLASGVTYLRQTGATAAIDDGSNSFPDPSTACQSPTVDSTDPDWTRASAALIDSGAQGKYAVWIEQVEAASGSNPADYRVCAQGTKGQGARTASVVATYSPAGGGYGPYAVYGKGDVSLESSAQVVQNMSVYSENCIDRKGNTETIGGTDLASGLPTAAHALKWVLDGPGQDACVESKSVHYGGDHVDGAGNGADKAFPYDTDAAGGLVAGDPDLTAARAIWLNGSPWHGTTDEPDGQIVNKVWVPGTFAGDPAEVFRARWNLPDMLGAPSITALETAAKQQGNYHYLTSASTASVTTPNENQAVVFLDFKGGLSPKPTINLKDIDFAGPWVDKSRSAPYCTDKSLIIVVRNANVEANGNRQLAASVVIKDGGFTKLNGNFDLIGGLFADGGLDLSGTGTVRLDDCAVNNPPPGGTPQVDVSKYVEYDRA